ncbi:MAG: serine protease [Pyrinomonadaceae bacterium]
MSRVKHGESSLSVQAAGSTAQIRVEPDTLARRDEAKLFLREFTRELIREISPATKILVLLFVLMLTGGIIYLGRAAYLSYRAQQQQNLRLIGVQSKRIDEHDSRLENLSEQSDINSQQISALKQADSDLKETNQSVLNSLSLAPKLWSKYSNGVCLIAGSYVLIDPGTDRPLRYQEVASSEPERLLTTGTEVPLTPEGNGPIFELEFVGTGFYVGGGYVLTNRHVASQPWTADLRVQSFISGTNSTPRLKKLLAFFPGRRQPITLKFKSASEDTDVAVCALETRDMLADIPALPLDQNSGAVEVGKTVVMMGYPTGPNRLLALLPEKEALDVQKDYGSSLVPLLDQLAKRKLIKPLTTQGHITDLYKKRIVFDTETSEGASGTPMFGESGQVIGITFAVFIEDRASNFAVPIRGGIELLQRSGWKPAKS